MKIKIGAVAKPFGLKGELKVKPLTDFVNERFKVGASMELVSGKSRKVVTIETVRKHQGNLLIKFKTYDSLTAVEGLQLSSLEIDRDELHELEDDSYYFVDLEDCNVYVDDSLFGSVEKVMDMPAHPVLRIKRLDNGEISMVPFVDAFIIHVDIQDKRIDVKPMEGLL